MKPVAPLAVAAMLVAAMQHPAHAAAQDLVTDDDALRFEITDGVARAIRLAVAPFQDRGGGGDLVGRVAGVISNDLVGTELFRQIPAQDLPAETGDFDSPIVYDDWKSIQAEALVTGTVRVVNDQITVQFRLFDVFSDRPSGEGMQFQAPLSNWRRAAHRTADQVHTRLTGEAAYFDSRIAFVGQTGPRNTRTKRIGVIDADGQNPKWLTDGRGLVLAPAFSPDGGQLIYISYASGSPQIMSMDLATVTAKPLMRDGHAMAFASQYPPDGHRLIYVRESGGYTDIWQLDPATGSQRALTHSTSIDTSPDYAPEGNRIVFESDRSGSPQLYVLTIDGGEARRISFGNGRYGAPVWSPQGDLIAFTKQVGAQSHIGVMRPDGSGERLLTGSPFDEAPTWAPNGRVIMFTRENSGQDGHARLHLVDITGRNMRPVAMDRDASDPAWGPLLP